MTQLPHRHLLPPSAQDVVFAYAATKNAELAKVEHAGKLQAGILISLTLYLTFTILGIGWLANAFFALEMLTAAAWAISQTRATRRIRARRRELDHILTTYADRY